QNVSLFQDPEFDHQARLEEGLSSGCRLAPAIFRRSHSLAVPVFGGYRRSNAGTDKQAVLPVHLNAFLAGHLQYHSFNRGVLQHVNSRTSDEKKPAP
ncbi:hypothetical protein, partial [Klebsiella variicola]|uniref:hypothetical protein n=1 Tax=Klebsiella variicola TaxID=244366 RepID=UPI00387A50BF